MSMSIRFKNPIPFAFSTEKNEPADVTPTTRISEAPDRGYHDVEAPESWSGRGHEAPDAGDGRMSCVEQEFTHGRSQS